MRSLFIIMKKELLRWSGMASFYIIFCILLFAVGLYTWFFKERVTFFDVDRIMPACLQAAYWGIAVFTPLLATGTIMEERKGKMFSVLLAKPLRVNTIVFGKLAAIKWVVFVFLMFTLLYYVSIMELTKVKLSYLLPIYFFLFLVAITYAAISMAVASFFQTYWKSYLWSYIIILFLHFVANLLEKLSLGEVRNIFNYLGIQSHFEYLLSGGFALSFFVYLGSLIFIGLVTTIYKLNRDNS